MFVGTCMLSMPQTFFSHGLILVGVNPLALERVDIKTSILKLGPQQLVEQCFMTLPVIGECCDIVNIAFYLLHNGRENTFHDLLGYVGRLINSHRQMPIMVKTERRSDGAQLLAGII
jgi:hypothetical protein